jgi:para-aminobenzoate synthetase component I
LTHDGLPGIGVTASQDAEVGCRPLSWVHTPEQVLAALRGRRHPFWLDSADPSHPEGRYSVVGCDPWALYRARGQECWIETDAGRVDFDHPLEGLSAVLGAVKGPPPPASLPLAGGAVGFFGYDLGRAIERLPDDTVDDLGTDHVFLAFYDWVVVFDHQEQQWTLAATARCPDTESVDRLLSRAEGLLARQMADVSSVLSVGGLEEPPVIAPAKAVSGFTREAYLEVLGRAIEHIYAGDIYQVNVSQRFAVEVAASPFELYRSLRNRTHAVFSVYLEAVGMQVLSLSPERFLRVRGREVETCPIKGTRPRGATLDQDAALATELCESVKDAAELAMIVDLERNDLGRVCEAGTVSVVDHRSLYTLDTVHHTVTRVVGRLRRSVDLADLLRATFPGGSITGAPKIRSMEIIEDLEPTRRGVYTGSVGYVGYDGRLDLNIAIRTVTVKDGVAFVQAGGGIVADSDPVAEYEESLTKARALLAALGATV